MTAAVDPDTAPVTRAAALDEMSTEELYVRSAEGDEEAFSIFHDRLRDRVHGVCTRVLRDPTMAEEVTQEVILEAWRKSERFDPDKGTAGGFIATLARRRAVDRVRSEQSHRDRNVQHSQRSHRPAFDVVADEVATNLDHWQVREALRSLTDRQREAIELAYFGGHTYRDVAKVLGIPEGTAKSRLRDGLARLRTLLEDLI